ncbi:hypothetical protein CBW16_10210 [Flavobacteriaceae bacterium JJC]|uniref:hypothetical protein n=1 Tax=Kaistella soli TaxID=2849654 RepID=UPI000B4BCD5A|nr:hypothetical protein [Kaistella soli]MBU8882351.1 hypothetical protein [Kaistella soli]OWK73127.1 hypothetical protein CBW16_10210 [Flavobacteriaceae bacterium JJC]
MQYFFAKKIAVSFFAAFFFAKNPAGQDIVRAFFRRYTFTFFFFIFSYPGLSIGAVGVLLIIKLRESKRYFTKSLQRRERQRYAEARARSSGILLCAVPIVNKLPLHFSAETKQFID